MYKNLSPEALGISGRQSELIELALTYGFQGLDLDIAPFTKQVQLHGFDHAARFLESAKLKIGGFELPVRWQGDDTEFGEDLNRLTSVAEAASKMGATGCRTVVMAASDTLPYHENFEFHRQRFTKIAETLAPHSIRLGLDFQAAVVHREGRKNPFIDSPDALLTLAKTVGMPNVGVVVDLWQWHVGGGRWDQLRELSEDQIVLVRAADIPADVPVDQITDEQRLLPGAGGVIDSAAVLELLTELGYQGPVTPFPHPSQFKGSTRDSMVRSAGNSIELSPQLPEITEEMATTAAVEGNGA